VNAQFGVVRACRSSNHNAFSWRGSQVRAERPHGQRRQARREGPPCFAAVLGDERSIRVAGRPAAGHRLIARAEPFSSIYAKFTGFRFSMSRLLAAFPVAAKAIVMV
jgi:hypothetical protein